jgi:hypothetical protein
VPGQVVDALGILRRGRVGAAVLRDEQRQPVLAVQAQQQPGQRLGYHRPVEVSDRVAVQWHEVERQRAAGILRRGHAGRRVVVDRQGVQRRRDGLQVAVAYRQVEALRVPPAEQRIGEHPVVQRVVGGRRRPVGVGLADDPHGGVVVGDRHRRRGVLAQCRHRQPVTEQLVVPGGQRVEQQRLPGRVQPEGVPVDHVHERLVERDPQLDPVAQRLADDPRVLAEPLRGVPRQPAPAVLQGLRKVPVVERGDRVDARRQQRVDQPVVEGDPGRVDRAGAAGLHPRPRDGQVVGVHAEPGHQRDVLRVPVVVVAGHVAGTAVGDATRLVREGVPDGRSLAVLVHRALDLVRGRGDAPAEVRGKWGGTLGGGGRAQSALRGDPTAG